MADPNPNTLSDNEIVERVLGGDTGLYEVIMRRYNRCLYRVAWAIVKDEQEAQDVIQETYVRGYEHLIQFAGRSRLSTWLTKIAIHEAWSRVKRRIKECNIDAATASLRKATDVIHTPEDDLLTVEAQRFLEQAISALPEAERVVFVMRSIEEISTAETAKCLGITPEAVKMRSLRARSMLRRILYERVHATGPKAFQFLGEQCDRVTCAVLLRVTSLRQTSTLP